MRFYDDLALITAIVNEKRSDGKADYHQIFSADTLTQPQSNNRIHIMTMNSVQVLIEKIQSLPAERIAEVEDFVDFLKQRSASKKSNAQEPLDFPTISVGNWPEDLSLRREDMYGDDGR